MGETIRDGFGNNYLLKVNSDGSLNANLVDDTFENPTLVLEYIISGTSTGVTGSSIGNVVKFIGAGSKVQVLGYLNDNLITVGSWV